MNATQLNYAVKSIDELLPLFPSYGHFNLSEVINLNFKGAKQILLDDAYDCIEQLLIYNIGYAKEFNGKFWIELTEKGREAQSLGGHFAFQKKQDENKRLIEEKLKYDVRNAKRIFKTYWWTFAFAVIGLAISLALGVLKLLEILDW